MRILTGNDLKSGAVIWWAGRDWSLHVEDAIDVGEHGEAVLAAEDGARRVNGGYIVDAEATREGARPAQNKDRNRPPNRRTDCRGSGSPDVITTGVGVHEK